jgi:Ras-related protein Rab-11A
MTQCLRSWYLEISLTRKKLVMDRFVRPIDSSEAKMTIGVDFISKSLVVDNQKVKLGIWNFSGERFRHLFPIYCRGARGGLFMFDTTYHESIAHVDDWLTIIKKEIKVLFPIICVGLTSKDNNNREVSIEEGIKIARSRGLDGYIEYDVETGENMEKMFHALVQLMLAE